MNYIEQLVDITNSMIATIEKKNADYSWDKEFFKNFMLVERLGICEAEKGFLVRMCDKLSRISTLIDTRDNKVSDERITDTLVDLAAYALLLKLYIDNEEKVQ